MIELVWFKSNVEETPEGLAIVGGAARSEARRILTGYGEPVRDFDVAEITSDGHTRLSRDEYVRLSKVYMEEDFANGHGIQGPYTLSSYLRSRDFTCNQVCIVAGYVIMTAECHDDIVAGIIRPSSFETRQGKAAGKLAAKARYLAAYLKAAGVSQTIVGDYWDPSWRRIRQFAIKALQRGVAAAMAYFGVASRDDLHEEMARYHIRRYPGQ